jgi:hypothetical protein
MRIHFSVIRSPVTKCLTHTCTRQANLGPSIEQNRRYKEESMATRFYSMRVDGNKAFKIIEANIYQPKTLWMKFRLDRENTRAIVTDNSSGPVTEY